MGKAGGAARLSSLPQLALVGSRLHRGTRYVAETQGTQELRDRRNVFSYCLKRLVLLIVIGNFQNGGNFPSVPTFPRFPRFPHVSQFPPVPHSDDAYECREAAARI